MPLIGDDEIHSYEINHLCGISSFLLLATIDGDSEYARFDWLLFFAFSTILSPIWSLIFS